MALTNPQRRSIAIHAARDKAEVLLAQVAALKQQTEQQAKTTSLVSPARLRASRQAADRALDAAQRVIDHLNRAIESEHRS